MLLRDLPAPLSFDLFVQEKETSVITVSALCNCLSGIQEAQDNLNRVPANYRAHTLWADTKSVNPIFLACWRNPPQIKHGYTGAAFEPRALVEGGYSVKPNATVLHEHQVPLFRCLNKDEN